MPVIDGAERPADDEARVQVEDRREIQLRAAADHQLRGVADPALIRSRRGELAIEDIGGDRLIVLAHRRGAEALAGARPQALLPHQPADAFLADALAGLAQVLPDPRPAVATPAGLVRRADLHAQLPITGARAATPAAAARRRSRSATPAARDNIPRR